MQSELAAFVLGLMSPCRWCSGCMNHACSLLIQCWVVTCIWAGVYVHKAASPVDAQADATLCTAPCGWDLPCGHTCRKRCGQCLQHTLDTKGLTIAGTKVPIPPR